MVVGSSPAVLIILYTWNITPKNVVTKINFQWLLLYKHLYNLILLYTPNINRYFNFILTNKTITSYLYNTKTIKLGDILVNKPTLNRHINFKTYFKSSTARNINSSKPQIVDKDNFYNLFLVYLQYTTLNSNQFFNPHTNFKTFFISSHSNNICYLNLTKIHSRWANTCNLLLNLFFMNTSITLFSIKTLKNEVLSFNWSHQIFNHTLFRYTSPVFFLKDSTFGITSTLIFKKFHQRGLNTIFLTDLKYHEKNLYYFNRFSMTTIGLVPYNLNPWLVTYAIPTSSSSLFIQYFFIKLLVYIKQYSLQTQFNYYKQLL